MALNIFTLPAPQDPLPLVPELCPLTPRNRSLTDIKPNRPIISKTLDRKAQDYTRQLCSSCLTRFKDHSPKINNGSALQKVPTDNVQSIG